MKNTKIPAAQIGMKANGAVITSATLIPAAEAQADRPWTALPEYCDVYGSILPMDRKAPNINFRVTVPTVCNGKAWHIDGSGSDGGFPGIGGRNAAPAGLPPTGSRIMCRYHFFPKYKGSGKINSADSYTCAKS